jgi:hypothetical protein
MPAVWASASAAGIAKPAATANPTSENILLREIISRSIPSFVSILVNFNNVECGAIC